MKALINVNYYDFKDYEENMYILFDKEIKEVGKMSEYSYKDYDELDCKGKLVMPGLVNGHSHIYSTFARGLSVYFNPINFKELLEQLWWKLDRNLTNDINYYSSLVSGVNYLKNGVTTIIDHHASGEVIGSLNAIRDGLNEVGLRSVVCFETSDRFDVDECIDENNKFITENQSDFNRGLFGMHAAFTLSDETLKKIEEETKAPIHIHVAESIMDQDLSLKEHGKRVIERLNDFNLIRKNSILTHCLYLSDHELDIIVDKKAVIALNVNSNMNNAVGLPDYDEMKKKGIKVIIGNDGISQNMTSEYHSLYYSMHHKTMSPLGFSLDDLKEVINNTYEYVSDILEIKLGKIEEGFKSDLNIIDYDPISELNKDNVMGHLFFGLFHDFKPSNVFVDGVEVLKDKEVNEVINNRLKQSQVYANKLWKRIEKEDIK